MTSVWSTSVPTTLARTTATTQMEWGQYWWTSTEGRATPLTQLHSQLSPLSTRKRSTNLNESVAFEI